MVKMWVLITVGAYVDAKIFIGLSMVVEWDFDTAVVWLLAVADENLEGEVFGAFDFVLSVAIVGPCDDVYVAFVDFQFSSSRPE